MNSPCITFCMECKLTNDMSRHHTSNYKNTNDQHDNSHLFTEIINHLSMGLKHFNRLNTTCLRLNTTVFSPRSHCGTSIYLSTLSAVRVHNANFTWIIPCLHASRVSGFFICLFCHIRWDLWGGSFIFIEISNIRIYLLFAVTLS